MGEPTSNLDPVVAKEVRDKLLELSRDRYVLYSSHNLYEAQEIGDYIILIKNGAISFYGRKDELRSGVYKVGIKASRNPVELFPGGKVERGYFVITVAGPEEVGNAVKKIVESGIAVFEVKEMGNPLEDLFTGGK